MRELKFRAWKNLGGRMKRVAITPFSAINYGREHPDAPIFHANDVNDIRDFMPDADIVEQYTGLKDKNGKEIYEGDIVEQFVCGVKKFKGQKCGRRTIWQVRWNEEECCFELHYLSGSLFGDSLMAMGEEYEVIGNIHENPELLEEEE